MESQVPVLDDNSRRVLEYMVANPSFIDESAGGASSATTSTTEASIPVSSKYVVVTSQALAPSFDRFVEWKRRKGVSIEVVTIEDVYASYSGDLVSGIYDNAGKLRQFLNDAYNNGSGIEYALLVGKHDIVPIRHGWYKDTTTNDNYIIPTDLYFADFDGNWDSNNNGYYGEPADNVDFYPEIFVGRLLVQSASEVENWTDKLISYENYPGNGGGCVGDTTRHLGSNLRGLDWLQRTPHAPHRCANNFEILATAYASIGVYQHPHQCVLIGVLGATPVVGVFSLMNKGHPHGEAPAWECAKTVLIDAVAVAMGIPTGMYVGIAIATQRGVYLSARF